MKTIDRVRAVILAELRDRRMALRGGKSRPRDACGHIIKNGTTVSINASAGAVGELTRLIEKIEDGELIG